MAPRPQPARRQTQSQNDRVYELGVQGRKTGVTLAEGDRDEHGFETLDAIFSSPEKDISSISDDEQDMEIDDGSEMGPATTRKLQQRQNHRPSLPRARSPIKTHLQSPARQNPHLAPSSSPVRGTIVSAKGPSPKGVVARKLDFSMNERQHQLKPVNNGHPKVNGAKARNGKLANGRGHHQESDEEDIPRSKSRRVEEPEEPDDEPEEDEEEDDEEEDEEEDDQEPMEMLDAAEDDEGPIDQDDFPEELEQDEGGEQDSDDESVESIEEPRARSQPEPSTRRGRKPKAGKEKGQAAEPSITEDVSIEAEEVEPPAKKKRGRPKNSPPKGDGVSPPRADRSPPVKSGKRGRPARSSNEGAIGDGDDGDVREAKRAKTGDKAKKASSSKSATTKEKGKPGRKRKSSGIGVDSPVVQRGPPLPRSRGLVTIRREGLDDMKVTRSGRASFKPVDWWRGERVEYDEGNEEVFEDKGRKFAMRKIKDVVRADPSYSPVASRGRGGRKPGAGRRGRPARIEEEIEREEWEDDPGRITGECMYWYPEYEHSPPGEEDEVDAVEEELAISENAIQLKDIKDATFKFAKTLTLPFFGSGIVDLPPGAEKRPKNSRKMQMVFFVHTGSVQVTVAQTTFKIGMGGMWFVPRGESCSYLRTFCQYLVLTHIIAGNHYSIVNDTDQHARIFFSQGCEVLVQPENEEM
ncbi:kinetochore CENP-C fungal-like protein [Xylariaceae sp. FL0016]|nr:kinetochore CENP-C fungal-like protein [Xylariaceae sp. FL0016]